MDMTGLETFQELIKHYYKRGVKVFLCEANEKVSFKLAKLNILQQVEWRKIFHSLADVLKFIA